MACQGGADHVASRAWPTPVSSAGTSCPTFAGMVARMKPACARCREALWSQQGRPSMNRSGSQLHVMAARPAATARSMASSRRERGGQAGVIMDTGRVPFVFFAEVISIGNEASGLGVADSFRSSVEQQPVAAGLFEATAETQPVTQAGAGPWTTGAVPVGPIGKSDERSSVGFLDGERGPFSVTANASPGQSSGGSPGEAPLSPTGSLQAGLALPSGGLLHLAAFRALTRSSQGTSRVPLSCLDQQLLTWPRRAVCSCDGTVVFVACCWCWPAVETSRLCGCMVCPSGGWWGTRLAIGAYVPSAPGCRGAWGQYSPKQLFGVGC
jgi:hypothetical protein